MAMLDTVKKWKDLGVKELTLKRVLRSIYHRIFFRPYENIIYNIPWGFYLKNREKISLLKDKHKGERCFVVANGPSLKSMDLTMLRDEITIGMNRIYVLEKINGFMPKYLVSIDGDSQLKQFCDEYDDLDVLCLYSFFFRNLFSKKENQIFLKSVASPKFSNDLRSKGVGSGCSVAYTCLQLAYYMGFRKVYLIGKDHSYNTRKKPGTNIVSDGEEENHFVKGYYKVGQKWDAPDYKCEEYSYRLAKKAFEEDGRIIKDATINGKLNVFEKVNYYELF